MLDRHEAEERIREAQQGGGRPIISTQVNGHRVVAVGSTVHWAKGWKTFSDFLCHYLKDRLGVAWGNAELAKPFAERHPIIQWYHAHCLYQQATIKVPGEVSTAAVTGIVACYLGLAYGLYQLAHNVELQERLLKRLRNTGNFQGAYYEILVARVLIRAGFTLELEDETDGESQHCEFSAVSKSGKKYWVEAKMRSIAGVLGKTPADGSSDGDATKTLVRHLSAALDKPAADARLIFLDINTQIGLDQGTSPGWHPAVLKCLDDYEASGVQAGKSAYVFVSNTAYHYQLDRPPLSAVAPYGLRISNFEKGGTMALSEAYRRNLAHRDAYDILEAFTNDTKYPSTFDGSLPSQAFSQGQRLVIGETYFFEDIGEHGTIATVTSGDVAEEQAKMYVGITDDRGQSSIITRSMDEAELHDYRQHRDAFFGRVTKAKKKLEDPMELFEWLMEVNKAMPRANILAHMAGHPQISELERLSDQDLQIAYTEGLVASVLRQDAARPPVG